MFDIFFWEKQAENLNECALHRSATSRQRCVCAGDRHEGLPGNHIDEVKAWFIKGLVDAKRHAEQGRQLQARQGNSL